MKTNGFLIIIILLLSGEIFSQSTVQNIPEKVLNRNSYKRYEWFYKQRAFPFDTIPMSYFINQKNNEQLKYSDINKNKNSDIITESIGPAGLDMKSHPHWGLVSGRVRALAVHPTDPNIVYIGAASGGIWKSTDGGSTWEDMGKELNSLTFGAIAIDPVNPQNVYAGGGEWMRYFNSTTYDGRGLFKSTNGGNSWDLINDDFGDRTHFSSLEVSPGNSNIIFATLASGYSFNMNPGNEGVWKSTDAGLTWTNVLPNDDTFDILPDPVVPNRVYAGGAGGFYISTDNGETWRNSSGMISGIALERMQIAISVSSPNTIYLLIFGGNKMRLFKSEDSGETWASASQLYDSGQGWYDLLLAVNPNNANEVYIGDAELRRSTTGGGSFSYVGGSYSQQDMHVDFHCMVFAPSNPAIRYVGCDGGVYKSTNSGSSWASLGTGLSTIQFYRIASHPSNSSIVFGGAQDNSNFRTTDGGLTWGTVTFADGMECFVDYADPNNVYMSIQYGTLYKSTNGGAYNSFNDITPDKGNQPSAWVVPYLIHPFDHNIIYTASDRPWKSTNGGTDWLPMTPNAILSAAIETMAISPLNPDIMMLAGDDTRIFASTNGGSNWYTIATNIPDAGRTITRVVCDPYDENTMYVVRSGFGSGKIYKSKDLGTSWENISGDLPDIPHNDLFIDPRIPGHLYTANDFGVYRSINGGEEWTRLNFEIPFVPVMDFDYRDYGNERILWVGTHGRSAYRVYLTQPDGEFIDLARPVGSETWIEGTQQKIVWWSNDVTSVDIDFSTDNGLSWESIATGLDASLREHTWIVPKLNSSECLIKVADSENNAIFDSSNRTFAINELAIPEAVSPVNNEGGVTILAKLEWAHVNGAESYSLQLSTDQSFTNFLIDEEGIIENSITTTNLSFNTIYYWRIKSENTGAESGFSEGYTFITQLTKPVLSLPQNNSKDLPTTITVDWEAVDGANNYSVQVAKSVIFNNVDFEFGGITATEKQVENLEENKKYYWRVKASNELTFSEYSDRWNFQTAQITSAELNDNIPGEFTLYPNYPNPFNPETRIRFGLPEESLIKISIFNSLGQLIEELLDGNLNAGNHEITWNASNYPSGIYFAKFQAYSSESNRQFTNNLKLILLK
ncbi:MAG: T9SS type A sorting domain-containing protein [bacterium]